MIRVRVLTRLSAHNKSVLAEYVGEKVVANHVFNAQCVVDLLKVFWNVGSWIDPVTECTRQQHLGSFRCLEEAVDVSEGEDVLGLVACWCTHVIKETNIDVFDPVMVFDHVA